MKTILLLLVTSAALAQAPVRVSKVGDQYFVSFPHQENKSVTWTRLNGPNEIYTDIKTKVITKDLSVAVSDIAKFWIISKKDTTSVIVLVPILENQKVLIAINGRFQNGKELTREHWAYDVLVPMITEDYSDDRQ